MHIYARAAKITNVVGRADYISNPDRQEHLLAVAGIQDKAFWRQLAKDCQAAKLQAGGDKERTTREAREIHVQLPGKILDMPAEEMQRIAQKIADFFREKYGVDSLVGLHESKTDGNVHVHVLFSERQRLEEPEIRVATRNTFLDERGVRCRTKKEILDADGQLRSGCSIIPKGEIISCRHFGPAEPIFGEKAWLQDCKQDLCDWINRELQPDKLRTVFDRSGPYLAQVKIGNGDDEERKIRIRQYNKDVRWFNGLVESGRIPQPTAMQIKQQVMLAPNRCQALKAAIAGFAGIGIKDEVDQGGVRTHTGPDEDKKRKLREIYRQAADYRKRARESQDSAERKILLAEARKCSAQIDRLRMELGYLKDEDYVRLQRRIEEDLRKKREWALRSKEYAQSRAERWYSLNRSVKFLRAELFDLEMKIFPTKADKARMAQIQAEIPELEQAMVRALMAEREAKQQAKEARQAYREAKQQARIQRRELRESQQKQLQRGKTGPEH